MQKKRQVGTLRMRVLNLHWVSERGCTSSRTYVADSGSRRVCNGTIFLGRTATRGLHRSDWAPQRPAALRAISNVASPIRNVPASNPISLLELPTGITEASILGGPINLKKIGRTVVALGDNVCIEL